MFVDLFYFALKTRLEVYLFAYFYFLKGRPRGQLKVPLLRRISSLRRNHSQRVSKYSLARRTISCHRILMNIGPAGLSNRDSKIKLLRSLYDLLNMPIFP